MINNERVRVDEAKKVKSLANEYHKAFIERTLGELEFEGVEAYEYAFFNKDDSENGDKILEKCALELRNQVAAAFRKTPGFKDMFSGKMFTTYFRKYNDVKKFLYDASDDKGRPKSGTVARRVIDENLPVYLVNSKKLGQALAVLTDTGSADANESYNIARKEQTMKFMVDEMPFDYSNCPFCKEEWNEKWTHTCSLTNWDCNLHEKEGECYGLKRMKGADDD